MIITKKKDPKEILKNFAPKESVFILGCSECSTVCKTGGEEEVIEMKKLLQGKGFNVTGFAVPDSPCVITKVRKSIRENKKAIDKADSILVLTCGLGAQSLKDNLPEDKPIHIACDTLFMGQASKNGMFLERCSGCGDCVLELTDAICPFTRCAKGLSNGPCGGQDKGKCELDKEKDCAWILIYEGLKKKGKLNLLKEIKEPKDYSLMIKPRSIKV